MHLSAGADTYVSASAPRAYYGAARRLELSARPVKRALLRFEVHDVRGQVKRATIRLHSLSTSRAGFEVYRVQGTTFRQRGLTFSRAPKLAGRIARSGPLTAGRWKVIDVTAAVRGNGPLALALTTSSRRTIALASREAGRALAPRLTVEYSAPPAPASPAIAPVVPVDPVFTPPAPTTAPVPADAPGVSGRAWIARPLIATPGTWTGTAPMTLAYQWRGCDKAGENCSDITGATESQYTVVTADAGKTVRVVVTASNDAGSATATSGPTARITAAPASPAAKTSPSISGSPRQDDVLSASAGKWKGATPMTFSYQWRRCDAAGGACADIEGATATKYSVLPEDVRGTVRVAVTATNDADAVTAVSKPTRAIVASGEPFAGAMWHMDEVKGSTMSDSLGSATGKIKGVKIGQPGFAGSGYRFSTGSLITVSSKTLNPGSQAFSFSAYVNFTQKPPANVFDYDLVRKGVSSTSGGDYKMEIFPAGQAYCLFRGSSGEVDVFAKGNLADGRWHKITCSKQDNKITVTVDGNSWSASGKVGSISNSAPLWIGAQGGGVDQYTGLMDEVSVDIG